MNPYVARAIRSRAPWSALFANSRLVLAATAITMSACATVPSQSDGHLHRAEPPMRLGNSFMILDTQTHRDKVKLLTDPTGKVHALIAISQTRQIVDIVIGLDGVEARHLIRNNVQPQTIDAAYDRQGRMHVISDLEHIEQRDTGWEVTDDTPWKNAGVRPYEAHFVPGWPDLLWAFSLDGRYVESPGRWTVLILGGIPVPLSYHAAKMVMAPVPSAAAIGPRQDGTGREMRADWCAIEPATTDSVVSFKAASDGGQTIYLLYATVRYSAIVLPQDNAPDDKAVRLIRKRIESLAPESAESNPGQTIPQNTTGTAPCILAAGTPISQLTPRPYDSLSIAVDRDSGKALALSAFTGGAIDANDNWATRILPPLDHYIWPHIASAGNGRFHVLVVQQKIGWWSSKYAISYLMLTPTGWSRAIGLGNPDSATWNGTIYESIDMVEAPEGRAFMVWPVPEGIKGQWLEPDVQGGDS